jgi:hypothetical protein
MSIRNDILKNIVNSSGGFAATFKGFAFQVGVNQSLATTVSTYLLIETGPLEIVLDPLNIITDSGNISFAIFEDVIATGGSALEIFNMDRNSDITPSAVRVELYSVVTDEGTRVTPIYNVIDDNNRSKAGQIFTNTPFILKPNTVYALKITHNDASTRVVNTYITAYRRDLE